MNGYFEFPKWFTFLYYTILYLMIGLAVWKFVEVVWWLIIHFRIIIK